MHTIKDLFHSRDLNETHISFKFLGIKFNVLNPRVKAYRKKSIEIYKNIKNPALAPGAKYPLRLLQLANVYLLDVVDKLCKENNLQYWLDFGTLLGAVRHNGFIPWDDDLDIGMLREDYEKFIELFYNKEIKNHPELKIVFCSNKKTMCFIQIYFKVSDQISLDIFPYDFYFKKTNDKEKKDLSKIIGKLTKKTLGKKRLKDPESLRNKMKEDTKKYILQGKTPNISKNPSLFWGIDFPHGWKNKVYDFETIFPLQEIKFEEKLYPCPNNSNKVLKNVYNNYMEMPKKLFAPHAANLLTKEEDELFRKLTGYIE